MFNFKGVESAKNGNFLKPGYYRARVSKVESGTFEQSGFPYIAVTFQTQDGLELTEKFSLKSKNPDFNPLKRLQYLHEYWLGEPIDSVFKSVDDIEEFFRKALVTKKAGVKTIAVGGEINGKIVYARLPFSDFIVDGDVELGIFDEDSDEWKQFVKKSSRTTEATGKKGGLLNDDDDNDDFGSEEEDEIPAPKNKTTSKKGKSSSGKTKKETVETKEDDDEDEDDFNW